MCICWKYVDTDQWVFVGKEHILRENQGIDITSVNEAIFLYSGFDRWCYTVRHNAKRIGAAVTNDVSSNPADGEKKQVLEKNTSFARTRVYPYFMVGPFCSCFWFSALWVVYMWLQNHIWGGGATESDVTGSNRKWRHGNMFCHKMGVNPGSRELCVLFQQILIGRIYIFLTRFFYIRNYPTTDGLTSLVTAAPIRLALWRTVAPSIKSAI
jgi:hypothetical protein